jgi:hypothetical protein
MYAGPARGQANTAVIGSGEDATITAIDGTPVNGGRFEKYEVLPGQHSLSYSGAKTDVGFFSNTTHTSGDLGTCFPTQPGHEYEVRVVLGEGFWTSQVVDKRSRTIVRKSACTDPAEETPGAISSRAVLPRLPRPRLGLLLGLGGDIGGEDLISATMSSGETQTLAAGSGVVVTLGGIATPLWIGNVVGLGVGGRIGIKYDNIDAKNGGVSLIRYPLSLWLQSYIAINAKWYVSLAGGAHKELSPQLSGSGVASGLDANFQSPWGWMADGGFLWADTWHLGIGFSIRYTRIHYSIGGQTVDASNVGGQLTFHFMR